MNETALKNQVLRYLKKKGYFIKYHSGYGGATGIPDILGCYKGFFIAIELKIKGNKPTKIQLYNLKKIREEGGIGIVAYSLDDVKNNLEREIKNKGEDYVK